MQFRLANRLRQLRQYCSEKEPSMHLLVSAGRPGGRYWRLSKLEIGMLFVAVLADFCSVQDIHLLIVKIV